MIEPTYKRHDPAAKFLGTVQKPDGSQLVDLYVFESDSFGTTFIARTGNGAGDFATSGGLAKIASAVYRAMELGFK